jgi:flagellar basal body-associated protein FliL
MSEESQEGGMSTIKKTIIGLVTTIATAAGAYITTQFNEIFGVEEEKTEEVAPVQQTQAPAPIILNVDNSSTNSNQGGGQTIIKEKIDAFLNQHDFRSILIDIDVDPQ